MEQWRVERAHARVEMLQALKGDLAPEQVTLPLII
jgi:hypothetical protein